MKTEILFIIGFIVSLTAYAQQSVTEKYDLPVYNCDSNNQLNFINQKHIIVLPDDTTGIGILINFQLNRIINENTTVKFESELSDSDYGMPLFIMGITDRFKKWGKLSLPFTVDNNGFTIDGYTATDKNEGFSFISSENPMRIIISGNSDEAFNSTLNTMGFGFDFVANNRSLITFFGNFPDKIRNMNELKKDHYIPFETKYYSFHFSLNLDSGLLDNIKKEVADYDDHVETFVKKMEVDLPTEKIESYIHADQTEISLLSGFLEGPCTGKIHGFIHGGIIHSHNGTGSLKHETNHYLFNQINRSPMTFLSEGIQTWYENFENPKRRESGLQTALEFIDEDMENVILTGKGFHDGNKYYRISGIFTDYLLETYGLEKFKQLFRFQPHEADKAYSETYGKPIGKILEDYKIWLEKQS